VIIPENASTGIGKTPANCVRRPGTQLVYIVSCSLLMFSLVLFDLKPAFDGNKSCTIYETDDNHRKRNEGLIF
jgi:hypothetical protein